MIEKHPIFLALDFSSGDEAVHFLQDYDLDGVPVKVGMELYYQEGPSIIYRLKELGHPIFLDLKLHDIPNTVKQAMKGLASLEVDVVNVHAAGGKSMVEAAQEGLIEGTPKSKGKPNLLAVTQLTSTNSEVLKNEMLIDRSMEETVGHYASLSHEGGADGVVCSVHEVSRIRAVCGNDFMTVTPGIRLHGSTTDDQVRIATPKEAKEQGAHAIVMGRGITHAENPKIAYFKALKEWGYGEESNRSRSLI